MTEPSSKLDIQTVVKLLAPRELGVELVPLSQIEQAESSTLWASIFFGVFCSLLGSVISLHTTAFTNTPVLYILWLFLIAFGALTIAFYVKGHKEKQKARRGLLDNQSPEVEAKSEAEQLADAKRLIGIMWKLKVILERVFKDESRISPDEFINRMNPHLSKKLDVTNSSTWINALVSHGAISIEQEPDGKEVIVYNSGWDPEKLMGMEL
jgi:hypothetical protein